MITDPGARRVGAFIVATLFLVIMADYETTAQLAVAFSFLILLVAAMNVGPAAFGKLQKTFAA